MILEWVARLIAWWEQDEPMAEHARRVWIRQQMEKHPAERGEHWRDR